jgi:N6-adenosine-specific RNA methylase IME4
MSGRTSGILFASPDQLTFLVDVPASLAAAQTLAGGAAPPQASGSGGVPLSRAPRDAPYAPTEPRSQRARARADNYAAERAEGLALQGCIEAALDRIRRGHGGDWCLARPFVEEPARRRAKKRRRDEDEDEDGDEAEDADPAETGVSPAGFLRAIVAHASTSSPITHTTSPPTSPTPRPFPATHANPLPTATQTLSLTHPQLRQTLTFRVPPRSAFALATLPPASPAALTVPPPRGFDLAVADPPWPNGSARRRGAYATARSARDAAAPLRGLLGLDGYLAEPGPDGQRGGIVAVWTAGPASRAAVRGAGGLFDALGLAAVEEWVWAKVTRRGEPVTPLDGVWRRPYEVLHLGHRRRPNSNEEPVVRRVIAAVPDLHSRKPCLKELFELLLLPADYQAVEIFARNLTAGWHAWGDEAILFNWDGYWKDV